MKQEFLLPDLGEGLTEAEIVAWHVAVGDDVKLNQTLAEVETAKAVVELPSPYAGKVSVLHAAAGESVNVGAPLIVFEIEGAEPAADAPAAPEGAQPNLVGYGAAPSTGRPARRARGGAVESAPEPAVNAAIQRELEGDLPVAAQERPRSTPPVRKYAKDRGVDIALVAATIGDRFVTRADVDAFLGGGGAVAGAAVASAASKPAPLRTPGQRETRIPIKGVRKFTAEAMVQSAFTAPHVTTFQHVDVTATMELVASLRADRTVESKVGPLVVAAKAICLALSRTPSLNAKWDDAAGEIVHYHYVDLGIAAATDRGLVVPNIRDAQKMTLTELADAIAELTETARAGKTSPAELAGGTFSITNFGALGMDAGTPILPPGQVGIMGLGNTRRQPWEYKGEIALRQVMTLSLSFDHRVADGAEAARFLKDVASILEEPGRAMLMR